MKVPGDSGGILPTGRPAEGAAMVPVGDERLGAFGKKLVLAKAKEAEDVYRPNKPIARSFSSSQLDRAESQLTPREIFEDIRNHDGGMWECIERIPNKLGGYVYIYRLRDQYNYAGRGVEENVVQRRTDAIRKINEMYPAIEPVAEELDYLSPMTEGEAQEYVKRIVDRRWNAVSATYERAAGGDLALLERVKNVYDTMWERTSTKQAEVGRHLQKMGYKFENSVDGVFLQIPDREALRVNWMKHKQELEAAGSVFPDPIDIISSKGIAGDMEFVEAYFCHDGLLSDGAEFVHDHFFHIIPAITLMLSSKSPGPSYSEERFRLTQYASDVYRQIMIGRREISEGLLGATAAQVEVLKGHLEKVEAALGAFVDTIASFVSIEETAYVDESTRAKVFGTIEAVDPRWRSYMNKRFNTKYVNQEVSEAYGLLKKLEGAFDAERSRITHAKSNEIPPHITGRRLSKSF